MVFQQLDSPGCIALAQCSNKAQVLLHGGDQPGWRDHTVFELDQAHAQAVDAVDFTDDLIAQCIHHAVVQAPVKCLGFVQQMCIFFAAVRHVTGACQNRLVAGFNCQQLDIAGAVHKIQHGFTLDHAAHLKRVADQLQINMGNLQSPLRHGLDQATSLQAGNHFAHGTQRHVQQGHQLALRNELPGQNPAAQDLAGKALVGLSPLADRVRVAGHDREPSICYIFYS